MDKIILSKIKSLLKTIKKTMPSIRNKYLAKELYYKALLVINELKNNPEEEKNEVKKT